MPSAFCSLLIVRVHDDDPLSSLFIYRGGSDGAPKQHIVRKFHRKAALPLQPGEERADGAAHQGVLLEGHIEAVGREQLLQQHLRAQGLGAERQNTVGPCCTLSMLYWASWDTSSAAAA